MVSIKKKNVSFKFKRLIQSKVVPFGRNVQDRIIADPRFVSGKDIAEKELKPALDTLEAEMKGIKGSGTKRVADKNQTLDAVFGILDSLARLVDFIADGDETVILAAGFEARKPGERTEEEPGLVTELTMVASTVPGEARLRWKKGAHANKTAIEWARDLNGLPAGEWQNGNYSDGSKLTINGLPSKEYLHFRARSLGSGNRKSPLCEPIRVFIY